MAPTASPGRRPRWAVLGRALRPHRRDQLGASGIYSNLLVRTLVGYNHVAGPAGQKLVPDLAVRVPTSTNGGRTYTFRLKRGIEFGPPVGREITAKDIRYAIERLARPRNGSLFAFVFADIQGFDAYRAGKAKSISGIRTPNAKTIVFTLTRPAGDFLHRMALPARGQSRRRWAGASRADPAPMAPTWSPRART